MGRARSTAVPPVRFAADLAARFAAPPAILVATLLAAPVLGSASAAEPPGKPGIVQQGSGDVSVGGAAAARQGDAASGAPVVQGSPDVFINGKPAARQGDVTGCGGVVIGGGSNVFINGKPAARAGDAASGCPPK
jgi:uncharacterized Zn-binding protein involved in type VI secretion